MLKYLAAFFLFLLLPFQAMAQDKVMDRIVAKGEINCGVYVLGSIFSYDTAGKPKGFTVDLMDQVSLRTGLKIKYTEISSFATLRQDMETGKFDMICAPVLFFPSTAMKFLPGNYLFRDQINIYADASVDTSKITKTEEMNVPSARFVGMDGELGGLYAPKLFPKAKLVLLPQGVTPAQMFLELQTKKADYIMLSRVAAQAYEKDNPNKLKLVKTLSTFYPSCRFFYPADSNQLKANIDAVLDEVERDGILQDLLKKHDLLF